MKIQIELISKNEKLVYFCASPPEAYLRGATGLLSPKLSGICPLLEVNLAPTKNNIGSPLRLRVPKMPDKFNDIQGWGCRKPQVFFSASREITFIFSAGSKIYSREITTPGVKNISP